MAYLEFLKQVEAFHLLEDEMLSMIETFCSHRQFQQGERLFEEGDAAAHLWVVMEGVVDLRFEIPGARDVAGKHHFIGNQKQYPRMVKSHPPYRYKLSAYCDSPRCGCL